MKKVTVYLTDTKYLELQKVAYAKGMNVSSVASARVNNTYKD
jgi:hypothetical protein